MFALSFMGAALLPSLASAGVAVPNQRQLEFMDLELTQVQLSFLPQRLPVSWCCSVL
jgi:hypothetical protein